MHLCLVSFNSLKTIKMKKLSLMMVGAMITSLTFAQKMQEEAVPSPVKNAFHKQFPNIMKVKWGKEEI